MDPQPYKPPRRTASIAFVYFGIAFTLSAVFTATLLTIMRPFMQGYAQGTLMFFMVLPGIIGVLYGVRVSRYGVKGQRILPALIRGLSFKR